MESYREYPIRCKTCNGQIACISDQYERLLQATNVEGALNELGLFRYCCRISLINPTIVTFNMENREAIEGFKLYDIGDPSDIEHPGQLGFGPCAATATLIPREIQLPKVTTLPSIAPGTKIRPVLLGTKVSAGAGAGMGQKEGEETTNKLRGLAPLVKVEKMEDKVTGQVPDVKAIGEGIPVEMAPKEFTVPDRVGFPTINIDTSKGTRYVNVGSGQIKQVKVLGGTYLAR